MKEKLMGALFFLSNDSDSQEDVGIRVVVGKLTQKISAVGGGHLFDITAAFEKAEEAVGIDPLQLGVRHLCSNPNQTDHLATDDEATQASFESPTGIASSGAGGSVECMVEVNRDDEGRSFILVAVPVETGIHILDVSRVLAHVVVNTSLVPAE